MHITDFFIKRPVFATAMSLLLVLVGCIAYSKLVIRQFPKIDANVISISTSYPGASASLMESFVTTPIENALTGISDLDYMTSSSSTGMSKITLTLKLNSDINRAMTDVQSKVSQVTRKLPDGVQDPTITEVDANSRPGLVIMFTSPHLSTPALTDYLQRVIIPNLSNINGVAQAESFGNRTYAMRIWLDSKKMRALNVSATDVKNALSNQNIQSNPGEITRQQQVVALEATTDLHDANNFNNLIIRKEGNKLIRLKNIGHVKLGAQDTTSSVYSDGKMGTAIGISYKSDANPLSTATAVKNALTKIHLPNDIQANIVRDDSLYIKKSIEEVTLTFAITVILVILVIFGFLGSLRLVFIPIVTIPLSIFGAFIIMFALNYTINTLTLLAFVLAIGMVVDDAIVVMENIHRHMLMGKSAKAAAMQGTRQIVFAVIGMTITLMAVYTPIGFTSGLTGSLFREFAFTLSGSVLVSGIFALTLSPMMCSKLLADHSYEQGLAASIDHVMENLKQSYGKVLLAILSRKILISAIMGLILLAGAMLLVPLSMTSGIAPKEDQGVLMAIAEGPSSASVSYTEKYSQSIAKIFSSVPEKKNYITINGMRGSQNMAYNILTLKDWGDRSRSVSQIIASLAPQMNKIPGLSVFLNAPPSLPGVHGFYSFEFVLTSTGSYQQLSTIANEIINAAHRNPNILMVRTDLNFDQPQFLLQINRNKAGFLGVSMQDIDDALNVSLGQPETDEFSFNGYSYYVIPQLMENEYSDSNTLNRINVRTSSGELIPLSTLISLKNTVTANSFNHFQGQRSVTFNAMFSPLYSTQQAIDYFSALAEQYMAPQMNYTFSGETRQFIETKSSMLMIFLAALLIIYLVLAAQFESFRDPIVILITVPLAITGALAGLFFSGGSLNIYTEIGLVTLIGLISKHGILMVEFAKQCRWQQGMTAAEAIHQAATVRLKPILMTTAAMVLGSVPLILASGAGAAARNELGWTIASGMTIGTLFTLFILPTMYLIIPGGKHSNSPNAEN